MRNFCHIPRNISIRRRQICKQFYSTKTTVFKSVSHFYINSKDFQNVVLKLYSSQHNPGKIGIREQFIINQVPIYLNIFFWKRKNFIRFSIGPTFISKNFIAYKNDIYNVLKFTNSMDFKSNRVVFDNKPSVSPQKNSKINSEFIFYISRNNCKI